MNTKEIKITVPEVDAEIWEEFAKKSMGYIKDGKYTGLGILHAESEKDLDRMSNRIDKLVNRMNTEDIIKKYAKKGIVIGAIAGAGYGIYKWNKKRKAKKNKIIVTTQEDFENE